MFTQSDTSLKYQDDLLDEVIHNKLNNKEEYHPQINTDDITDIIGDYQFEVTHISVKPTKKINWRREPAIQPHMNRAFVLRKECILQKQLCSSSIFSSYCSANGRMQSEPQR